MAVTDLTGTSWHLIDTYSNSSLKIGNKPVVSSVGDAPPTSSNYNSTNGYWLKCKYSGQIYEGYIIGYYDNDGVGNGGLWIGNGTDSGTQLIKSTTFYNPTYEQRTLRIVGGRDATNTTLINGFVNNTNWKQINSVSVDLTTLPGWSSLSTGSHSITIVAKANGYRDSKPSAAVSVEKAGAGFVQIFPTKTSDNYTLINNLNQSKIYSIYTSGWGNIYLKYENGSWQITGAADIVTQTENSVKMYFGPGGFDYYGDGITLEGDIEATEADFAGFSSTNVYAYYRCIVEGTKITLSDGSTKLVQDIQYGDMVLCYDFYTGKQTTSYIDWMIPERIATKYWEITLSDGTILNLVGSNGKSHRLYNITKQRFDYPQDFEPSDLTLKEDGTTAYVVSCREIEKEVKFYNIASHEHINVYANGVLTSNRLNNRFRIVDNKFTAEKVMTDKEVTDYCDYLDTIRAKQ